jgi:hypothetical protein
MGEKVDQYAQVAYMQNTIVAAGTLTFALLQISKFALDTPKLGLKIARVEIDISAWMNQLIVHAGAGTSEDLSVGLTVSNLVSSLSYVNPEVIYVQAAKSYFCTAIGTVLDMDPIIKSDFTGFPGGGLLIPADRLYLAGSMSAIGAAVTISSRMWYTVVPLDANGYLELIEQRSILST